MIRRSLLGSGIHGFKPLGRGFTLPFLEQLNQSLPIPVQPVQYCLYILQLRLILHFYLQLPWRYPVRLQALGIKPTKVYPDRSLNN
jgi:hypothetical protein